MAESYQRGIQTGAEPGHPVQKPRVTADQGITDTANQRPDIASTPRKSDPSVSPKPSSATAETGEQNDDNQVDDKGVHYPEQKHAGKVGYGPNYAEMQGRVTLGERVDGLKQEFKGKVKRDPEMVKHGHDVMTGEAKRRAMDLDANPIQKTATPGDTEGNESPEGERNSDEDGSKVPDVKRQESQKSPDDVGDKPVQGQETTDVAKAEENPNPNR